MILVNQEGAVTVVFDDDWTAELAMAAYFVALRHCATGRWLDLQLELWRALTSQVADVRGALAAGAELNDIASQPGDWLAELAYVAYRIALPYGHRQSFLALELELYQVFCRTVESTALHLTPWECEIGG